MIAMLRLVPWWVWPALALVAALGVQTLRIQWQADKTDRIAAELATTAAAKASLEQTLRLQRELYADAEADEHKATTDLADALEANKRLAGDVAAGKRRLLVKGTCVPSTGGSAGAAGVGEGRIEISADAGRAHRDHRAEVIKDQVKLAFLIERYESVKKDCGVGRVQQ